jgi:hypothetical protein
MGMGINHFHRTCSLVGPASRKGNHRKIKLSNCLSFPLMS